MNSKQLIAITAAAFLGNAAVAQEVTSDAWMDAAATKSRAEVRAELDRAPAAGRAVNAGEATLFVDAPAARGPVRAVVQTQARATVLPATIDVHNVGA